MAVNAQVISKIKLRAIEQQHARLRAQYDAIIRHADAAPDELERFERLYEGLQGVRFAQRSLHPEVSSLDALRLEARVGTASPALMRRWMERLEREVDHGRRRATLAHLFGRLLDEWAGAPEAPSPADEAAFVQGYLADITHASSADGPALRGWLARHAPGMRRLRTRVEEIAEEVTLTSVSDGELRAHLKALTNNPDVGPTLQQSASALLASELELRDHAGALSVMISRPLDEWSWPPEGMTLRPAWRWVRWRPFLDVDLLEVLRVEILGMRWSVALKEALYQVEPFAMHAGEQLVLACSVEGLRRQWSRWRFLPSVPATCSEFELIGSSHASAYGQRSASSEKPDAYQQILAQLLAEVSLARATRQEGDVVCVVQTDIRRFFQRIPHGVALSLFEAIGLPSQWLGFLERFMQTPARVDDKIHVSSRGIPLGFSFSYLIAETLLRALDAIVFEAHGVRLIRFMDDIFFVTRSPDQAVKVWAEIENFCADCGLELNESKSGATCLGAARPARLPQRPARWGALELNGEGWWRPCEAFLTRHRDALRAALSRRESVLGKVAEYNHYTHHLVRQLGLFSPLDSGKNQAHLEVVARALADIHGHLFGPGEGIVEHLQGAIRERFGDTLPDGEPPPPALMYWPVTAGGLGLCQPIVTVAGFMVSREAVSNPLPEAPTPPRGQDWLLKTNDWWRYFGKAARLLTPMQPAWTPAMSGLRDAFITRGGDVSGKPQHGLATYWQWILHTYGPQLLDEFGALSVLIPELVPMQLIANSQKISGSLGNDGPEEGFTPANAPIFHADDDVPF